MKKILFLSIFLCFFCLISFAQYIVKPTVSPSKTDTTTVVVPKKNSEAVPVTGAKKSVAEKYIEDDENDENEFDEKELDELEASIAKAKATLGIKNVSITSSKSVPSKNKEVFSKVEENKAVIAAPTTTYEAPSLMLNGRVASEGKPKADFKQTILTEEEKKFYNSGGLKVNDVDEVDRDSIYISPTISPSFVGGIDALKAFFAQNLKIPEVMKGQEIKGRVFVRFVVRKDGKIDKVHLVKGPNDECNFEAIRVIKMMPAWLPASDKGDAVSSYHVLPISFATIPPIKK
jgi:Gram-negative bacterial TonB protein C-terminal